MILKCLVWQINNRFSFATQTILFATCNFSLASFHCYLIAIFWLLRNIIFVCISWNIRGVNSLVKSYVYKKILDSRPYDDHIFYKIEGKNHLYKNFCYELKEIAHNSKLRYTYLRKIVGSNILRMWQVVAKGSRYSRNNYSNKLREDIINSSYHVFGEHKNCDSYFCEDEKMKKKITSRHWQKAEFYIKSWKWSAICLCIAKVCFMMQIIIMRWKN